MNNNIRFLDKKDYVEKIYVKSNENKNFYLIDTLSSDVNLFLEIFIENNANIDIIVSSLNKQKFQKNYRVVVHHLDDNSTSSCYVYGVNKDESNTLFDLEAIIKDTSKGNYCEQSIKGVLLSNDAKIEGKPNLIINTNNIKAKHALAIGRLNPAHIFYLQNKGIKKDDAIKLMILSYFDVILHKLNDEKTRSNFIEKIYYEIGNIDN